MAGCQSLNWRTWLLQEVEAFRHWMVPVPVGKNLLTVELALPERRDHPVQEPGVRCSRSPSEKTT